MACAFEGSGPWQALIETGWTAVGAHRVVFRIDTGADRRDRDLLSRRSCERLPSPNRFTGGWNLSSRVSLLRLARSISWRFMRCRAALCKSISRPELSLP